MSEELRETPSPPPEENKSAEAKSSGTEKGEDGPTPAKYENNPTRLLDEKRTDFERNLEEAQITTTINRRRAGGERVEDRLYKQHREHAVSRSREEE